MGFLGGLEIYLVQLSFVSFGIFGIEFRGVSRACDGNLVGGLEHVL